MNKNKYISQIFFITYPKIIVAEPQKQSAYIHGEIIIADANILAL